jgi:hypothetical protein
MACDTPLPPKTKGYTTKRRYQQTRQDKQKTLQIMNDQLDILFLQDIAAPHKASITHQKLADLPFEVLKHPA